MRTTGLRKVIFNGSLKLATSCADKPMQAEKTPQSPIDSVSPTMSTTSVQEASQLPRQRPAGLFGDP